MENSIMKNGGRSMLLEGLQHSLIQWQLLLFLGCFISKQCHTEIKVVFYQTCYLNQSQSTDAGPTSPNRDQCSH